jgi:hypothetical protein
MASRSRKYHHGRAVIRPELKNYRQIGGSIGKMVQLRSEGIRFWSFAHSFPHANLGSDPLGVTKMGFIQPLWMRLGESKTRALI